MAIMTLLVKGALTAVIAPFIEEAREVALDTAQSAIRSMVAGKMSIDEWANTAIKQVDDVKKRAAEENNLQYVGGKLKFSISASNPNCVAMSFQLYFQDENNKWHKAEAASDVPASKFTGDDLNELKDNGEVVFDVE